MGRKRIYYTIRIDTIEGKIAHFKALGDYNAVDALRYVFSEVSLDWEKINAEAKKREEVYFRKSKN